MLITFECALGLPLIVCVQHLVINVASVIGLCSESLFVTDLAGCFKNLH